MCVLSRYSLSLSSFPSAHSTFSMQLERIPKTEVHINTSLFIVTLTIVIALVLVYPIYRCS